MANLMFILGIIGFLFIAFEIVALQKSVGALPSEFPQLSAAQFTRKQALQRNSAWCLIGGAVFMQLAANLGMLFGGLAHSPAVIAAGFYLGIPAFVLSLVVSAVFGSLASSIK